MHRHDGIPGLAQPIHDPPLVRSMRIGGFAAVSPYAAADDVSRGEASGGASGDAGARVRVLEAARHTDRSAPGNLMRVDLQPPCVYPDLKVWRVSSLSVEEHHARG